MTPDDPGPFGSAWGLPTPTDGDVERPDSLGIGDERRYVVIGPLGTGGMGVVEAVHDTRLDRQVARKRPVPGSETDQAIAQWTHEARILARLDHPHVVPVHDAGIGPDGQPYVTLRQLDGQPLDMDQGPFPQALRHLLDACRGVAHAHARGVVHADLKPANILVGEGGETWVADWGLARSADGLAPPVAPGAGTPPWTAPEVLAGQPPTPAADVYALGIVLGDALDHRGLDDPALQAIRAHATAKEPGARYADARALGDDLARWLDGRRVVAHRYGAFDLLRLFVRAWRIPLGVSALAALGLGAMLTASAVRVASERDRALRAESELQATVVSLWADRAATAWAADRDRDAWRAARSALHHGPSPTASGVLHAVRLTEAPVATATWTPDVRLARLVPEGVLLSDGESTSLTSVDGTILREWPIASTDAVVDGDALVALSDMGAVRLEGTTRSHSWRAPVTQGLLPGGAGVLVDRLHWIALDAPPQALRPCPPDDTIDAAVPAPAGGGWAVCSSGQVVAVGADRRLSRLRPVSAALTRTVSFAHTLDGQHLLAGTLDGMVLAIDPVSGALDRPFDAGVGPVARIASGPDGWALAIGVDGRARLVRPTDRVRGASIDLERVRDARWDADGSLWLLGNGTLWTLPTPTASPITSWQEASGVSALAIDSSRAQIAVGVGPEIVVRDPTHGRILQRHPDHLRRVKGLAFRDGALFSAAVDDARGMGWRDAAGREVPLPPIPRLRRIVSTATGHLVAINYGSTAWVLGPDDTAPLHVVLPQPVVDLVAAGDRTQVLDGDGAVWTLDPVDRTVQRHQPGTTPPTTRIAASAQGHLARAGADGLTLTATDAPPHRRPSDRSPVEAMAFSAAADHLAVGLRDGRVQVLSVPTLALVWEAAGHTDRVAALVWTAEGGLLSAGWDGRVRSWAAGVP